MEQESSAMESEIDGSQENKRVSITAVRKALTSLVDPGTEVVLTETDSDVMVEITGNAQFTLSDIHEVLLDEQEFLESLVAQGVDLEWLEHPLTHSGRDDLPPDQDQVDRFLQERLDAALEHAQTVLQQLNDPADADRPRQEKVMRMLGCFNRVLCVELKQQQGDTVTVFIDPDTQENHAGTTLTQLRQDFAAELQFIETQDANTDLPSEVTSLVLDRLTEECLIPGWEVCDSETPNEILLRQIEM